MSNSLKGTLLTVVAGIAWGLSGTSGQYLMAHGISALVLTNLRLLIAGGILMILPHWRNNSSPAQPGTAWWTISAT